MISRNVYRFAGIAALTAVLGCENSTGPGELGLSLDVERTSLRLQDSVLVSVEATNAGSGSVRFVGGAQPCGRLFEFLKDGSPVPNDVACALVLEAPIVLKPGTSETLTFVWVPRNESWPTVLEPGTYQLRARAFTGETGFVTSRPVNIEITSNQ